MDVCEHLSLIDDFGTGDSVCTNCGLVMEEKFQVHTFENMSNFTYDDKESILESLIDFTWNAHLPCKYANQAFDMYKKKCTHRRARDNSSHNYTLAFAAMYTVLHMNKASHSLREISKLTGISDASLSRAVNSNFAEFITDGIHPLSTDLCNRICSTFNIPNFWILEIMKRLEILENIAEFASLPPSTLLGALLLQLQSDGKINIDQKDICTQLSVTLATLKKHKKKIEKRGINFTEESS